MGKGQGLRVGLLFNLKRVDPKATGDDAEAEFDSPNTVGAIAQAIASFGHTVVEIEATPHFPEAVRAANLDAAFNLSEGLHGRAREAVVPAVLDLVGIPYTGSDATTLALALDKQLAKTVVRAAGVRTARSFVMRSGDQRVPRGFRYPLMVKPNAEGSSKGITKNSVVHDEAELRKVAGGMIARYAQGALVEEFLPGREFTVGLLGDTRSPEVLPPMEIVFTNPADKHPIYSFEHKLDFTSDVRYDAPAQLTPALDRAVRRCAAKSYAALGCRDVSRIDLRLDAAGRPNFIEVNPLPGLTPDFSDLCLIAKSAGIDYVTLIGKILQPALDRVLEGRGAGGTAGARHAATPSRPAERP